MLDSLFLPGCPAARQPRPMPRHATPRHGGCVLPPCIVGKRGPSCRTALETLKALKARCSGRVISHMPRHATLAVFYHLEHTGVAGKRGHLRRPSCRTCTDSRMRSSWGSPGPCASDARSATCMGCMGRRVRPWAAAAALPQALLTAHPSMVSFFPSPHLGEIHQQCVSLVISARQLHAPTFSATGR